MSDTPPKSLRKKLLYLSLLPLSWFLLHIVLIVWDGLSDEIKPADLIVVLGNKIEANGQPSLRLQARLERALSLYQQHVSARILVSGGVGVEGFDEAKVMKEFLVARGVPSSQIWTDAQGIDTRATAKNTKRFLEEHQLCSAIIVSQYHHISRTKLAFSQEGIQEVYSAHAQMGPELRDPYSLVREFVGYYAYLFSRK
jgi:vancomycin permeability regulator SanA